MPLWSESELSSDRTWKVAGGGFFFFQPSLWMLHGSFLVLAVTARWLALYEAWRNPPSSCLSLYLSLAHTCSGVPDKFLHMHIENLLSVGQPHHNCRRSLFGFPAAHSIWEVLFLLTWVGELRLISATSRRDVTFCWKRHWLSLLKGCLIAFSSVYLLPGVWGSSVCICSLNLSACVCSVCI